MRKIISIFILAFFVFTGNVKSQNKPFEFNGYAQFRFYTNNGDESGFWVRRTKLWIKGTAPKSSKISYKVMGIFDLKGIGSFNLLDAYVNFESNNILLRIGRQVPMFSLQRAQSDWAIPVLERASVINNLIPDTRTGARDIGALLGFKGLKYFEINAGVFNGSGANNKHHTNNFLYTARLDFNFQLFNKASLSLGGATLYHYVKKETYPMIFGAGVANFSGKDFRFDLSARVKVSVFTFQSEYIEAHFNSQKARGYYAIVSGTFSKVNQLAVSFEKYSDINSIPNDEPWAYLNYSRLLNGQKTKVMLTLGKQYKGEYLAAAQFQLFFR